MTSSDKHWRFLPAPDHPGWYAWNSADASRYNGVAMGNLIVQPEGDKGARLRLTPARQHSNLNDVVHGGVTLGLIDNALFAAAFVALGTKAVGAVTLELATQFISPGQLGVPLDASAEVLHMTQRLVFLRGLVTQGDTLVAAFSATLRKPAGGAASDGAEGAPRDAAG